MYDFVCYLMLGLYIGIISIHNKELSGNNLWDAT